MTLKTPQLGPVLIELDDPPSLSPADAPEVPDTLEEGATQKGATPEGASLQGALRFVARKQSKLARWFWTLLFGILGFFMSIAVYETITGLLTRHPFLGLVGVGLVSVFLCVLSLISLQEWLGFVRLRRVDELRHGAIAAAAQDDLSQAQHVLERLKRHYRGRADMRWSLQRLKESEADVFDAESLFTRAENVLMQPLDARAQKEVEAAARQVATITAIVPLALVDVVTALSTNMRMIRKIAEIYGGRSGTLGSLRLMRAVVTHLVATGAVAVGDDLISSLAGGGLLSKVSRRFGEGVVNGALTARVGVAAIEICRPLPYVTQKRPSVTKIVKRALTGVFRAKS